MVFISSNFLVCCVLFMNYMSDKNILDRVLQRKGYKLSEIESSISVRLDIKPEWIQDKNVEAKKTINKIVLEKNNTEVILDKVSHRGHDIYFIFDVVPNMNYKGGLLLHNTVINSDGSYSTNFPEDVYKIVDTKGDDLDYGQHGYGPEAKFGFAIDLEHYDKIRNGFTVKYKGLILYEYSKN